MTGMGRSFLPKSSEVRGQNGRGHHRSSSARGLLPSARSVRVDVRVELVEGRLRALVGEADRLVDRRLRLLADRRQALLVGGPQLEQRALDEADRVALAPLPDLVLGP